MKIEGAVRRFWFFFPISAAILLNLAFPYPGLSYLAWFALSPLFAVMLTERPAKVMLSGVITGVLFNAVYLDWLKEYRHPASFPAGIFVELVYFFFAVMLAWFLADRFRDFREEALAAGWLIIDYLRSIGYLAFPWGILGYTQYANLIFIQSASLFGVWGITFLILYGNAVIAGTLAKLVQRNPGERISARFLSPRHFILAALVLLAAVSGFLEIQKEKKRPHATKRIALIQGNFDPWSPQLEQNIQMEIDLTRAALSKKPDLIVWSESSVPFPYDFYLKRGNKYARMVHDFILSVEKPFLFGSLEFQGVYDKGEFEGNFYNVAIFYNGKKLQGVYRKIHLVPFGEWFPYDNLFPFVKEVLQRAGAGDFTPGTEYVVFDAGDFSFSVLICFEDVFGDLARVFVKRGASLLVNVTNDAWTGSRKAEVQHFSISVFRAVENRTGLVRAANGGVTVLVNSYGKVLDELDLFTSDFLIGDIPIRKGQDYTIYTRYGDFFPRFIAIAAAFSLFAMLIKKLIDRMKKKHIM